MSFHLGNCIKKHLKQNGLKKTEFAKKIGQSPRQLYHLLECRSMDTEILAKISKTLGVDFFSFYQHPEYSPATNEKTSGEIMNEIGSLEKEMEMIARHNNYLREIIQLYGEIHGSHLPSGYASRKIKQLSPRFKSSATSIKKKKQKFSFN
ncbi:MAG: helix-turn-helix transcriptional regulator [Bacteroidetes bacterium]|nr:helix-turn-helix transcriptional regulator [Bacteroidota bacterium]